MSEEKTIERRNEQREILSKLDNVITENEVQDIAIIVIQSEMKRLSDFIENHMDWEEAHQKLVLKIMSILGVTAISLIGYILVTILSLSTSYGIIDTKVKHNSDIIEKVDNKQDEMLELLYSIKKKGSSK